MKFCRVCNEPWREDQFYTMNGRQRFTCKSCHKNGVIAKRFNLTVAQLVTMREDQLDRCAICNRTSINNLSVDHDHKCCPQRDKSCGECVRALLCQRCNIALGLFDDDVDKLLNAMLYLRKFEK